jgi:hypothetical protein
VVHNKLVSALLSMIRTLFSNQPRLFRVLRRRMTPEVTASKVMPSLRLRDQINLLVAWPPRNTRAHSPLVMRTVPNDYKNWNQISIPTTCLEQPDQMHNPLGITFHPSGTFNQVAQGGYIAPQDNASNGTSYRHVSMQQPFLHPKGCPPNRGRNPNNSSRLERSELNDNRWYQNNENFNTTHSGFSRGGNQRGGRKGTGRRGGHNQRNATAPVTQPHVSSDPFQKMRDGGLWKNGKWRREGSDPIQVTCRNVQDGYAIRDYVHCSCQMCEARNRSVHVAVESQHEMSSVDMQSRIKYGLSRRYGLVDEVYPLPSKEPGRFIVRFVEIPALQTI